MTTIIYCASWEKGEAKFDELINNIPQQVFNEYRIIKRKRGSQLIHSLSGCVWKVVYAYDGARGNLWDECLVDEDISIGVFNQVILPAGRHSTVGNGVNFY